MFIRKNKCKNNENNDNRDEEKSAISSALI
jgi:hypothetical protein